MNNKQFVPVLILSLLLVLALAFQTSAFTYEVEPIKYRIVHGESAEFQLTVINTADYADFFTISTRDVHWIVDSTPASGLVPAGEEAVFIVKIKPVPLVPEGGSYSIPIKIKSEKTGFNFEEKKDFTIYLAGPFDPMDYVPTVTTYIYMDNEVDPREKVSVRLNLRNRNPRDLEGLKVVIDGGIFYKEYTTHLLRLEEKTNEILFEVDPLVEPGTRTATVTLFFDDNKVTESSTEYDVEGYSDLEETPVKKTFLCRTEEKYSIMNKGNDYAVAEKKFRKNFIQKLFTSFSPDAVKEKGDDGKTYYVIRKELGSEERLDIVIVTNYRIPVIILLLIITGMILYYILRSPIIIIKSAEPLGKTKEGVSEVKVRLYLKNRSRKPVNNVRVADTVPRIAEIEKKARLGSMEPINLGKSRRGTVARWELDVLESYEERIITYKIKSRLKLIGGIRLPSAKARFDSGKGKERVTYSNGVNLVHG